MVKIFRRHTAACTRERLANLSHRQRKAFLDCDCMLWASGKDKRFSLVVPRQSLRTTDLAKAKALVESKLSGLVPAKSVPVDANGGMTIEAAATEYLKSIKHEITKDTLDDHELMLNRFRRYAARRGVALMAGLTPGLCESFKFCDELKPLKKNASRAQVIAKFRAFLKWAYSLDYVMVDLSGKMRAFKYAKSPMKIPFTDDQVAAIMKEAEGISDNFLRLCQLALMTGKRPSDAMRFDPKKLANGEVPGTWVYEFVQTKRKITLEERSTFVLIDDEMKIAIEKCQWLSEKLPFWGNCSAKTQAQIFARYMKRIGKKLEIDMCSPHIWRHTAARVKLESGVDIYTVSKMLGHSSIATTEKSYNKFVPSRARHLERALAPNLRAGFTDLKTGTES